jgi:hypothetical protein
MGFLKGFATFILSFIFFIALAVFSVAYMIHSTMLSYDFVANQVDKLPISSIARNIAENQVGKELPKTAEFLKEVAYNVIEEQEPWMKTQLKTALYTGYDYFLSKTDTLSITVSLSELKRNLSNTLWQETMDYFHQELAGKSNQEISQYLQDIIDKVPQSLLPPDLAALPANERNQLLEQFLRYSTGLSSNPDFLSLDEQYKNLGDEYINRYLNDFISQVPDAYTLDESSIDSGIMHNLQQVRQYIGYFQTYYIWLIILLVFLMALIFLVNWSIKVPARTLGIELFIFGVIDLAGIILVRMLPTVQSVSQRMDIPSDLSAWIIGLISDITAVGLPLAIGILVVGVIMLVVSFVVPSRKKEELL